MLGVYKERNGSKKFSIAFILRGIFATIESDPKIWRHNNLTSQQKQQQQQQQQLDIT